MSQENLSQISADGIPSTNRTTQIINCPYTVTDVHGAMHMPIYRNAAFDFVSSAAIADAFQRRSDSHTYTRITNPTVEHFEHKVRLAAGASHVMALGTGMAAISHTLLTLARAGSNIIASPHLFGNTYSFLSSTLVDFGVETRFVDTHDLSSLEAAIDQDTIAFFAELITNPHLEIADFSAISQLLRPRGIPMVVDSTVVPWCAFDARAAGVDIEVVSTTKYVSGGATSLGGVIVDYGTFTGENNPKLAALPQRAECSRFMYKLRTEVARNIGAVMTPDTAYQQSLGMETLSLRFDRASRTAYALAQWLQGQPQVVRTGYPLLEDSAYQSISRRLFHGLPGAMLTLTLPSQAACYRFMDALHVFHRATNLFDNRSLVIHPASTIYGTFSPAAKAAMGIEDTLVRLSIGLENLSDLQADISQALQHV